MAWLRGEPLPAGPLPEHQYAAAWFSGLTEAQRRDWLRMFYTDFASCTLRAEHFGGGPQVHADSPRGGSGARAVRGPARPGRAPAHPARPPRRSPPRRPSRDPGAGTGLSGGARLEGRPTAEPQLRRATPRAVTSPAAGDYRIAAHHGSSARRRCNPGKRVRTRPGGRTSRVTRRLPLPRRTPVGHPDQPAAAAAGGILAGLLVVIVLLVGAPG